MYRKILVCTLVFCATVLPASATKDPEYNLTPQDLNTVVTEAKSWNGTRYRYGGKDRRGIDCSNFVYAVFNKIFEGFDYRMADEYLRDSTFVPTKSPIVGDLIVFPALRGISAHVGIITDVRGKKFIGSQTSTGVKEASFASGTYWGKRPYKIVSLLPVE